MKFPIKTKNLCLSCFCPCTITSDDNAHNLAKIKEQREFRKPYEPFIFNFRLTCSNCGTVYIPKIIKNVKINRIGT